MAAAGRRYYDLVAPEKETVVQAPAHVHDRCKLSWRFRLFWLGQNIISIYNLFMFSSNEIAIKTGRPGRRRRRFIVARRNLPRLVVWHAFICAAAIRAIALVYVVACAIRSEEHTSE